MSKGIQITSSVNIRDANQTDFVVNTDYPGSMKVYKILTFKRGGTRTTIDNLFGTTCDIQRYKHGLSYIPAYLAYGLYYDTSTPDGINNPVAVETPYSSAASVLGDANFVNVTSVDFIIGFDVNSAPQAIQLIIFAEKVVDT